MALSYPLTAPDALARRILGFTIRLRRATGVAISPFTGEQQVYSWPFAVWEADLQVAAGRRFDNSALETFITSLRGRAGTFVLGPWYAKTRRGTCNTTGVTVNGANQTGNALAVTGLGAGKTLLAGSFLQLGSSGGTRLHQVVEDAIANGSGAVTLTIEPALRAAPSDGAAVVLDSPKGLWRLTDDAPQMTYGIASVYEPVTLSCMEAL